jgi:hypothetical protein
MMVYAGWECAVLDSVHSPVFFRIPAAWHAMNSHYVMLSHVKCNIKRKKCKLSMQITLPQHRSERYSHSTVRSGTHTAQFWVVLTEHSSEWWYSHSTVLSGTHTAQFWAVLPQHSSERYSHSTVLSGTHTAQFWAVLTQHSSEQYSHSTVLNGTHTAQFWVVLTQHSSEWYSHSSTLKS